MTDDERSGDVFDGRGDEVEHAEVEVIEQADDQGDDVEEWVNLLADRLGIEPAEVAARYIEIAIKDDGPALVFCVTCDDLVGVDKYGLDCGHGREHAPPLSHERFDDVFESRGVIGRLRDRVASAFE